jgi:hypothetical protein
MAQVDIALGGELQIQHQASAGDAAGAGELSLMQAGRDVAIDFGGSVRVAGPGDLLISAGRDVDFGRGYGVKSIGNQENPINLPTGGATISVIAGVAPTRIESERAAAADFALVGAGLTNFPADVAVQLQALKSGAGLLAPDQAAAASQAFAKLSLAEQQALVRSLVGDAAYDASVAAFVERSVGLAQQLGKSAAALVDNSVPRQLAPLVPGSQLIGLTMPVGTPDLPKTATGAVVSGSRNDDAAVQAALNQAGKDHALGAVLADYVAQQLSSATRSQLSAAVSPYSAALLSYVRARTGRADLQADQAQAAFASLSVADQLLFEQRVAFDELRSAGRSALNDNDNFAYLRGYLALDALFPAAGPAQADIRLSGSQVKTQQGGDINMLAPRGSVNVGDLGSSGSAKSASDIGIVTVAGGAIRAAVRDQIAVNQSRVFSLAQGDVLLWAGLGNVDAGRGAKTVTGSPAPLYTINSKGEFVVDTSGSFSGSGIAVLDPTSTLDLYAPMGEINAGDAGIRAKGNANFGAVRFVGADNLAVGGSALGAPPPPPTSSVSAVPSAAGNSAAALTARPVDNGDDEDQRRKRRNRRRLWLDFLGFGSGD